MKRGTNTGIQKKKIEENSGGAFVVPRSPSLIRIVLSPITRRARVARAGGRGDAGGARDAEGRQQGILKQA